MAKGTVTIKRTEEKIDIKVNMAKQYKGSLSLEWFNKQKSILALGSDTIQSDSDVPAPRINWINKEESLFYEISEKEGVGNIPYWVNRDDIRVKEARPLVFQKAFRALKKDVEGTIPGTETSYEVVELNDEGSASDIDNLLIKGDNLLALNSLRKHLENQKDSDKVKCIFIDPPYNTGSAFEQYDDNLAHSEWLTLLRDRLVILRDLLSETGSIWITIDDDESHYLKLLCDEVFGRDNFVSNVVWEKKYSPQNDAKWFSDMHDHILVYAKDKENWRPNLLPRTGEMNDRYKNPDNDPRGPWKPSDCSVKTYSASNDYPITTPSGRVVNPPASRCWVVSKDKFDSLVEDNRIWFGESGNNVPSIKKFLTEVKDGMAPKSIWTYKEVGHNQDAKKEVKSIETVLPFDTPKPEKLLERVLYLSTTEGDLVLDIFGGSGTTFAVAHKMKRKWIGVEIGEHAEANIIPRLKGVISGSDSIGISKTANWLGGGGFKYYLLGESIISIDPETQKGEFNWSLGKKFIQESLLLSYDFLLQDGINLFPAQLFQNDVDKPTLGKITKNSKSLYGVVYLAEPTESNLTITNEEVKTIYSTLKKQDDFTSLVIYTNKGIDIAQDTIPEDLDIIKVPHAVFAELER